MAGTRLRRPVGPAQGRGPPSPAGGPRAGTMLDCLFEAAENSGSHTGEQKAAQPNARFDAAAADLPMITAQLAPDPRRC